MRVSLSISPFQVERIESINRFCSPTSPLAAMPREIISQCQSPRRAVDAVEIVGGGILAGAGRRRGRRHADRRHARAVRAVEPVEHVQVVVAVQHQIGAVRGDDAQQHRRVEQALVLRPASLTGG